MKSRVIEQDSGNHHCYAYISFGTAAGWPDFFREIMAARTDVAIITLNEEQQTLGIMIGAENTAQLAERFSDANQIAGVMGMAFQSFLTSQAGEAKNRLLVRAGRMTEN
jgi:hypothetical protein